MIYWCILLAKISSFQGKPSKYFSQLSHQWVTIAMLFWLFLLVCPQPQMARCCPHKNNLGCCPAFVVPVWSPQCPLSASVSAVSQTPWLCEIKLEQWLSWPQMLGGESLCWASWAKTWASSPGLLPGRAGQWLSGWASCCSSEAETDSACYCQPEYLSWACQGPGSLLLLLPWHFLKLFTLTQTLGLRPRGQGWTGNWARTWVLLGSWSE